MFLVVFASARGALALEDSYTFENGTVVEYGDGKSLDISGISVNLTSEMMCIGGIGCMASAAQLMARGMQALGNKNSVYSLPFSVDSLEKKRFRSIDAISTEDRVAEISTVRNEIKLAIDQGFTRFNIPITHNSHASLASFIIKNGSEAELFFYDSLRDDLIDYKERYSDNLCKYVKSLLPESVKTPKSHQVLHLLDQGNEDSTGCGYYTVYTGLLLRDSKDFRNDVFGEKIWFDASHDARIRSLLAVITMLEYGVEKVDVDWRVLLSNSAKHIFEKLGDYREDLKLALLERNENVNETNN